MIPPRTSTRSTSRSCSWQNGSAILVALVAEHYLGDLGVTLVAVAFTLAYFVAVEAMSKTYGILHGDRAALALAPIVWALPRRHRSELADEPLDDLDRRVWLE